MKTRLKKIFWMLAMLLAAIMSVQAFATGGVSITGLDETLKYSAKQAAIKVSENAEIANASSYSNGSITYAITEAKATETLSIPESANASTLNGDVSIVDGGVFLGDGTSAIQVGSINSINNGLNGKPLQIDFSTPLENGDFETALDGSTVPGWTVNLNTVTLGALATKTQGRSVTTTGTSAPYTVTGQDYSFTSDITYTSEGLEKSTTSSSFTKSIVTETTNGIQNKVLRLVSSGRVVGPSGTVPYGSLFGPEAISDPFTAKSGDTLAFNWKAANGGDDYEVYGFLEKLDGSNNVIDTKELLYGRGKTQDWSIASGAITSDGKYRYRFVCGSYDHSGGLALGASLYIDNIRLFRSNVDYEVVQKLARMVTYYNDSDTPDALRTINISLVNKYGDSATEQVNIDSGAPTVAIATAAASSTNISPIPITITFSEAVTDFDASDITVGNGTASNFSGSGTTYTVDIIPDADGTVTVDVGADVAQDVVGNGNTAAIQLSRTYDVTAPTVSITSTAASATNAAIPVTITFNEAVTGFDVSDITVGNGTAGSFSGSGSSYTAIITPTADGEVTVDVNASVAQDTAGNTNTAASQLSRTYDEIIPTGTLTINNGDAYATSTNVSLAITSTDGTGTGVEKMRFSNDASTWSVWEDVYQSKDWAIQESYGVATVYMQLEDAAGNISSNVTDTIQYKSVPQAIGGVKYGTEDTSLPMSVTDFVYNNADGSTLDKIMIMSLPVNGTLKLDNTNITVSQEVYAVNIGNMVFVPDNNWNGETSFTWKVSDGVNYSSQTASMTISIAAVNDVPKANNGNITVNAGTPSNGTLSASDIDGDNIIYSVAAQGTKGTAIITNTGTGAYTYIPDDGAYGSDSFTFKVNDGAMDSNTASVAVNIIPSGVADLKALSVSSGSLNPAFAVNTMDYAVSVGNTTDRMTVTASVYNLHSTAKIGGVSVSDAVYGASVSNAVYGVYSREMTLSVGTNIIPVEITAQDGTTKKTYTITATRAPSSIAFLQSLGVSSGSLSPVFGSQVTEYTVNVANNITGIMLAPTLLDSTGTVRVNGALVDNGGTSGSIALTVWDNMITVEVTAQDGATKKNYTINVKRAPSNNATLTGISIADVEYTPVFDSETFEYSASVLQGTSMITIVPTPEDSTASISINGTPVAGSSEVELLYGNNTVTIKATAQDRTTIKTYKFNILRPRGNNESNTTAASTASTPAPSAATAETGVNVLVNGRVENAGTASTVKEAEKTTTTITVDQQKLEQKLAAEGQKAVVTIPVNTGADVVVGELNGQMVKNMEAKEAVLEVKTDTAAYTLPAQQINIDAVSDQIGTAVQLKDIKVQVEITKSAEETVKVVENSAKKGEFTIVAPPVEFNVRCTYGDQTVSVSSFNAYVERTIAIPEGVDPSKITTGVVLDSDGTVRHVPTKIVNIDGKYYAKINSLTNSTYSVVWHPLEFKDVETHWAKEAVNDMGSRMVISGVGDGRFEPDRSITRAEFAAIMVRGLGLKPGIGENPFVDVAGSEWYGEYISTAYKYGIISGYGDNKFGPDDKITREQAIAMIARAMKITGFTADINSNEIKNMLSEFVDSDQTALWARESIASAIKAGIVVGENGKVIAPTAEISRAEVAAIVKRLLEKSGLI